MDKKNGLSIFAADEKHAVRKKNEDPHEYRTEYQRDRDRILYSKAFRRLSGKTQVFVNGVDDHTRTRLTHTLEVAQIAHTISKKLKLNLDITEAIALGHDLGHAPFGHIGERTLNYFMNGCYNYKGFTDSDVLIRNNGFKHNWQSVRIVTDLTGDSIKDKGLNITLQTIWGMLNHTDKVWDPCKMKHATNYEEQYCLLNHTTEKVQNETGQKSFKLTECKNRKLKLDFFDRYRLYFINAEHWTIEAYIVKMADEIAQRHHDIEDGLFSKIIKEDELLEKLESIFGFNSIEYELLKTDIDSKKMSNKESCSRFIVNTLVSKLIRDIERFLRKLKKDYSIKSKKQFHKMKTKIFMDNVFKDKNGNIKNHLDDKINYDIKFRNKDKELKTFLKNRILNSHHVQVMDGRASFIIRKLFHAFISNPQQLSDNTIGVFFEHYIKDNKIQEDLIKIKDEKGYKLFNTYDGIVIVMSLNKYIEQKEFGELRNVLQYLHYQHDFSIYKRNLVRTICDHIAGMTDKRALQEYHRLYGISHEIKLY